MCDDTEEIIYCKFHYFICGNIFAFFFIGLLFIYSRCYFIFALVIHFADIIRKFKRSIIIDTHCINIINFAYDILAIIS